MKQNWRTRVYHQAEKKQCQSKRWIKKRIKVFTRDKYQCQMCKHFHGEGNLFLTAHHLIPRGKTRNDNMRNLITLCPPCHDIAEIRGLNKKEILDYKSSPPVEISAKVIDKDWRKWVYGGYKRP